MRESGSLARCRSAWEGGLEVEMEVTFGAPRGFWKWPLEASQKVPKEHLTLRTPTPSASSPSVWDLALRQLNEHRLCAHCGHRLWPHT